jgi:hypothetical protein
MPKCHFGGTNIMTKLVELNKFYELLEKLQVGENVSDINLENYNIGSIGIKLLSQALKSNNTVNDINLCNNMLGDAGTEIIAELLQNNIAKLL